jgi:hypothetical protein
MPGRYARIVCVILLVLGVAAALAGSWFRARAEAADRTVAVVLDYDQLCSLAAAAGRTTATVLDRMKQSGATGVALTEQTVYDVLSSGEVFSVPVRRGDDTGLGPPRASLMGPPEILSRVRLSLVSRLGLGLRTAEMVADRSGATRLNIRSVALSEITDLGIGYPPHAVHEANLQGLGIIARPRAEGNQWEAASAAALTAAKETGAELVVFSGNAVMGYPGDLRKIAGELSRSGLLYGYVEFGKQYGDTALAALLPERFLRVHSINETEMLGISRQRALDRFVLAVRERNIRVCYVRLFAPDGADPLASSEAYVRALTDGLKAHGFRLGSPRPLRDIGVPWLLRWLACLGALAAAALCLTELLGCRPWPVLIGLGSLGLLTLAGATASLTSTMKLGALLAALALPTLAVGWHRPSVRPVPSTWAALGRGIALFAASSAVSVLGGLLVVGCLADARFMVKLDQFTGVKLAHGLPLLGVLLLQLGWEFGGSGKGSGEPPLVTLVRGWRAAARSAVRYWQAVLLIACAGVVALLLLRTGHETGLGVSGLELQFRSLLNRVFGVRPRSKELLIGHPLLLLGLVRAAGGKNVGRWVLLSLGAIGQVSLVNTFTHIHTPLLISVTRTLHGLWFGALVGVGLYLLVEFVERLGRPWWSRLREQTDMPPD